MDSELTILAIYGFVVLATLAAQTTGALSQLGMGYLLSARDEQHSLSGMAARLDRATNNSVTALALFAPAVLLIAVKDAGSPASLASAQAFLIARIAYVPLYVLGVRGLRTAFWLVGFIATAYLYALAL